MKIVALIDNSKGSRDLVHEWGLSLHIEVNGKRVLFDTGKSPAFAKNAEKLNVDLTKVDIAVLSHGHGDHGGGLATFFSANKTAPLYLRTTADDDLYGKILFFRSYVGLDRAVLNTNKGRLRWLNEDTEIASGIHVLTSIPDIEPRSDTRRNILVKTEHGFAPDSFKHELALVTKENDGISVFTGCGHLGILNMILAAKEKFPESPLKAVIGGFHLIANPVARGTDSASAAMKAMALRFDALGCQRIISGHCTGKGASMTLQNVLQGRFIRLRTGATYEV